MLLADQDRARWDRGARSPRARRSCGAACAATSPGPYQLQAAINAVHSDAPTAAATDWRADPRALRPAAGADPEPGRRAQPRGRRRRGRRAGRRRSRSSTPSTSTATTCSTRSAPTCCAASAATPRRPPAYEAAIAAHRERGRAAVPAAGAGRARRPPASAVGRGSGSRGSVADQVHRRRADERGDEEVRGAWKSRCGVSHCCSTPSRSTATRSPSVIASTWSCVT